MLDDTRDETGQSPEQDAGRPTGEWPAGDGARDAAAGGGAQDAATGGAAAGAAKPRRRQARGERRVQQLLDAAAEVFTSVGYSAASTNAIARTAGVSPGTLYQFFPNKEAIAVELGERLTHQMREYQSLAFSVEHTSLPLEEMLDAILDPLIEFNCCNPALMAVLHSSDVPGKVAEDHDALHASLLARAEGLLALHSPGLSAERRSRIANMSFTIFKAGMLLVMAHEGAEQDAYILELKSSIHGYLAPVLDSEAARAAPARHDAPTPR